MAEVHAYQEFYWVQLSDLQANYYAFQSGLKKKGFFLEKKNNPPVFFLEKPMFF